MHTCPPPKEIFDSWLKAHSSTNDNFGHLLLLQREQSDNDTIQEGLRQYFESAHLDARQVFHEYIGIDLHPDAENGDNLPIEYPKNLYAKAQRGMFGEVIAGLVSECCELVGNHSWTIPVFLFRHHDDVRNYLFNLARNPGNTRETIGRLGSDFIGLSLDESGAVARFIAGEAKWRASMTPSVVDKIMLGKKVDDSSGNGKKIHSGKGVWRDINNDPPVPTGMRQLSEILKECDRENYDAAIFSMQQALFLKDPEPLPRTDLIIIIGNAAAKREEMDCLLPYENMPTEYTAGHDLQLVEVVLDHGEDLIEALYQSLWSNRID